MIGSRRFENIKSKILPDELILSLKWYKFNNEQVSISEIPIREEVKFALTTNHFSFAQDKEGIL